MPQVKVLRDIKGKKKDVYSAVKEYLDGRETLAKLGATMQWNDKSCSGVLEASSFSGALEVNEKGDKSQVAITIELPFLLTPLKGKVEEELNKHLGRVKV
jgi:hypothetical protein